jgi:hypothetical protein
MWFSGNEPVSNNVGSVTDNLDWRAPCVSLNLGQNWHLLQAEAQMIAGHYR